MSFLVRFLTFLLFTSCIVNSELTKKTRCKARNHQSSSSSSSSGGRSTNNDINKKNAPKVYLLGDSTMATCRYGPNYSTNTSGWGTPFTSYMSIKVENDAISGYSSREAYRNKMYDKVLESAQPGDFAIIQWGRNDVSSPNESTLHKKPCSPINNDYETVCKGPSVQEPEVYTFVKYLEMAANALQQKKVNVIIASLTTKSTYQTEDGQFHQEINPLVEQAKIAAEKTKATFVDVHTEMTRRYQNKGAAKVKHFYLPIVSGQKPDYTHTTPRGALVAAQSFLAALARTNSELNHYVKQTPSEIVQPVCH